MSNFAQIATRSTATRALRPTEKLSYAIAPALPLKSDTAGHADIHGRCDSIHFGSGGDHAFICMLLTAQLGRICCVARNYLLIILVIALLGGFSGLGGGPFYGTGYYGGGGLSLILLVVLVLVLLGRL